MTLKTKPTTPSTTPAAARPTVAPRAMAAREPKRPPGRFDRLLPPGSTRGGFTLIELLIVIAIIGVIGTLVTTDFIRKFDQAKVDTTKIQIRQIGTILDDYRRVCNHYPTTDEGLDALVHPPASCKNPDPEGFLKDKQVPKDAWGDDFIYTSDGNKYTIKSLGADDKEGGDGFDKDISSDDPQ